MKPVQPHYDSKNQGHYSPGIIAGGMLYVSGQLSIDPDTRRPPGDDVESHTRQALANLDRVLKAARTSRERVVLCRVYLPDIALWDRVNRVYAEFFGEHRPARVMVPTNALHFGCLVEIEAIAEVGEK